MRTGKLATLLSAIVVASGALLFLLKVLSSAAAAPHAPPAEVPVSSRVSGDFWRILADLNQGRGDAGVVAFDDRLYVMGGFFSVFGGYPDSLEIYDPVSDTWEISWGIPVTRSDLMAAEVGGKIYAIGGWREDMGASGLNNMYDPALDSWITRTTLITPVSGAGVAVISETIYIIGGFDNFSNTQHVQIYDPAGNSWSLGTPMPTRRSELGAVVLDGKIFAIGGVTQGGLVTSTVEVFDPATGSWSNGPALPAIRAAIAVVVREGKIVVFGGTDDWVTKNEVDTTFVYDPGSGLWSTSTAVPTARWALEAAVIGDKVYVVGGAETADAGSANEGFGFEGIATTTTITADDPDPSLEDQPFTVDFMVTATEGIPTGIVSVTVESTLESCSDSLVNGTGSCVLTLQLPGSYTITASYMGDAFSATSSDSDGHTVLETYFMYLPLVWR